MRATVKLLFIVAALIMMGSKSAYAQFQPTRPVKIIIPFSAGSGPDAALRAIAQGLTIKWGQPVIIENRPGRGTVLLQYLSLSKRPQMGTLFSMRMAVM